MYPLGVKADSSVYSVVMKMIKPFVLRVGTSVHAILISSFLFAQSLQPDHKIQHGNTKPEDVKKALDRILNYLDRETPAMIINRATGELITDLNYKLLQEHTYDTSGAVIFKNKIPLAH